jgi:hypothetical protein
MGQDFSVADRTGQELPIPFDVLNVAYPTHGGGWPMTPSEQFLRFAAECESMVKFTHDRENKPVWHRSAERWIRCAELAESQSVAVSVANAVGRQNSKLGMRASLCRPEVTSRTAPFAIGQTQAEQPQNTAGEVLANQQVCYVDDDPIGAGHVRQ